MTSEEARAAAAEAREAAAEHEDALQALALRTQPLGADRHHRTYWWPLGAPPSPAPSSAALVHAGPVPHIWPHLITPWVPLGPPSPAAGNLGSCGSLWMCAHHRTAPTGRRYACPDPHNADVGAKVMMHNRATMP